MESTTQQQKRITPASELDWNYLITESLWGKTEINKGLKDLLTNKYKYINKEGEEVITTESMWDLLSFYTRDLRFANLSSFNGEMAYTQYYLDLAGDFLQSNQRKPFLICLSRLATVLELSQSKGGFLRKRMNTLTSEQFTQELEPPKKSLFGFGKKKEG